jgi:hypothetical protein
MLGAVGRRAAAVGTHASAVAAERVVVRCAAAAQQLRPPPDHARPRLQLVKRRGSRRNSARASAEPGASKASSGDDVTAGKPPVAPAPATPDASQEREFNMALPTGATLAVRLPHAAGVVDALRWLLASRDGAPLGLDVEGTVSLLQLSTPTRAVLLRWRALVDDDSAAARDGFAAVCALLADAAVQKVGCELRQDALVLLACSNQRARLRNGRDFTPALPRPNAPPGTVLGLFKAYNARNAHPEPPVKDTASRDSDWDAVTLTRAQLEYAALDAWMSHRLGCHAELAADKRVVSIDITAVSTELEGAWEKLSAFKALRRRGTEVAELPDILALPDENDIAPQWLTLPSGERVLLCSAFGGPRCCAVST